MMMMMRRRRRRRRRVMMTRGFSVCQVYCSFATVSFCCQSLIAKEHINFSSRTGEDFTFLFICSCGFLPPFSKVFHSVGQAIKKKTKKGTLSCQTAATVSAVITAIQMLDEFTFEQICLCMLQLKPHEDRLLKDKFHRKLTHYFP